MSFPKTLGAVALATSTLAAGTCAEGPATKPGERIRLGSFSPLPPPESGPGVADSLPGAQAVLLDFAPARP